MHEDLSYQVWQTSWAALASSWMLEIARVVLKEASIGGVAMIEVADHQLIVPLLLLPPLVLSRRPPGIDGERILEHAEGGDGLQEGEEVDCKAATGVVREVVDDDRRQAELLLQRQTRQVEEEDGDMQVGRLPSSDGPDGLREAREVAGMKFRRRARREDTAGGVAVAGEAEDGKRTDGEDVRVEDEEDCVRVLLEDHFTEQPVEGDHVPVRRAIVRLQALFVSHGRGVTPDPQGDAAPEEEEAKVGGRRVDSSDVGVRLLQEGGKTFDLELEVLQARKQHRSHYHPSLLPCFPLRELYTRKKCRSLLDFPPSLLHPPLP
eukprot:756845-Hanusia_phi.AAC.10